MDKQAEAERRKRAMVLESEGQQLSKVNIADGFKKAAILASEGVYQETVKTRKKWVLLFFFLVVVSCSPIPLSEEKKSWESKLFFLLFIFPRGNRNSNEFFFEKIFKKYLSFSFSIPPPRERRTLTRDGIQVNRAKGEAEAAIMIANATAQSLQTVAAAIAENNGNSAVALRIAEQ